MQHFLGCEISPNKKNRNKRVYHNIIIFWNKMPNSQEKIEIVSWHLEFNFSLVAFI